MKEGQRLGRKKSLGLKEQSLGLKEGQSLEREKTKSWAKITKFGNEGRAKFGKRETTKPWIEGLKEDGKLLKMADLGIGSKTELLYYICNLT